MATQTYSNLAQGSLSSAYTIGDTSLALHTGDGARFPATGDFVVALDDPPAFFLKCTARSGDTLTVAAAAAEGSTRANTAIGIKVTQVITAGVLDGIRADLHGYGTRAGLPTSGMKTGDTYRCSDGPYEFLYTGSAWQAFVFGYAVKEPVLADFSQDRVNGTTFPTVHGGIGLQNTAGWTDIQVISQALPGSGAYYVDAAHMMFGANPAQAGVGLSDGTKLAVIMACTVNGTCSIGVMYLNSFTSFSGSAGGFQTGFFGPLLWTRIYDDGATHRTYYVSSDGEVWYQVLQESRTTFLTPTMGIFAMDRTQATRLVHFSIHG